MPKNAKGYVVADRFALVALKNANADLGRFVTRYYDKTGDDSVAFRAIAIAEEIRALVNDVALKEVYEC